jgi:uncharacterized linocin/CFP29 family protein
MAFTLEDGTGIAGANAYVTVAEVDAYHLDRFNPGWKGDTEQLEAAIIRATDYVETRWRGKFRGQKASSTQGLSFPRENLCDELGNALTGVPQVLKNVVSILALCALAGPLYVQVASNTQGQAVTRLKRKVGPIETDTQFVAGGQVSTVKKYPEADRLMGNLVTSGRRIIRA